MSKEEDFIDMSNKIQSLINEFELKYAPSYSEPNTFEYIDTIDIVRIDGFGRNRSRLVGLNFNKSIQVHCES